MSVDPADAPTVKAPLADERDNFTMLNSWCLVHQFVVGEQLGPAALIADEQFARRAQPVEFFDEAVIDADGTLVATTGQCKEGMDIAYTGVWGYHPLLVSLAKTREPLYLINRSGNRPSAEGAAERFDQARTLCRDAGFRRITFRGDTDFSQTGHLDRWDADGVRFVFGYDARANVIGGADALPARAWTPLVRQPPYEVKTTPRQRPVNAKAAVIIARAFKNLRLEAEACDVVLLANDRCNQENLIDQLKHGVGAMQMPVDTLLSNWAYMVMTALAWSLKAWFALRLPTAGRWAARYAVEKAAVLRMEYKAFLHAFILIPVQVVRTSRRLVFRLLAWNPWQAVFLRGFDQFHQPLRQ